MTQLDHSSKKLAKRLAVMVAEAGEAVAGEVEPALRKLVGDRPLAERRAFVRAFLHFLDRELRARRLVVEHAGPLKPEDLATIAQPFLADHGQLAVVEEENPLLLGGVRITLGDHVYDASIAGRLERLAAATR
ncbi:MAG: F0F1 ATP synthase subunit delta [Opitutales bacterium]